MKQPVLVVDDEPLVLRSVERTLRRAGFQVHGAQGRREALDTVHAHTIDLALVDFALGRDNGLDLLDELRELAPDCLRVLMTANRDFPVVVDAVNRGEVVRVLNKPFRPRQLVDLVTGAIAAHATRFSDPGWKIARDLEDLTRRGAFQLALQPIVRAHRGRVVPFGHEVLLRPDHPAFPKAGDLLDAAGGAGRLAELDALVLARAARSLDLRGHLFINLSPALLADLDALDRALEPFGERASRVVLEITEGAPLDAIPRWEEAVRHITDRGFAIALDDVGAGYNSLSMLADLSPTYMKIDMALIRGVDREPRKRRLVQLLATFAHATGAFAVAEGVETAEEARVVSNLGIQLVQGYFYGRPTLVPDSP